MSRPDNMIVWLTAAVMCSFVAVVGVRLASAVAHARTLEHDAARCAVAVAEIEAVLRRNHAAATPRSTDALMQSVRTALAGSQLPDALLRSLVALPDESPSGGDSPLHADHRIQSISLLLSPITTREFGRFLDAWRQTEPAWFVTTIRLDRTESAGARAEAYSARLTISSICLHHERAVQSAKR